MPLSLNPVLCLWPDKKKRHAKELMEKAKRIVSSFSRGNTNLQKGAYVTRAEKDARFKALVKKFRKI